MSKIDLHARALSLGATLYMPVINPHAWGVLAGQNPHEAGSVVLCLEDALHEDDIDRGLKTLAEGVRMRKDMGVRTGAMVFVRPRNLDMARLIVNMDGIETIDGLIVPKMTLENGPGWFDLARRHGLPLMPTLETAEAFDPGYVSQIRAMFDSEGREHILAVRIGGNDLLNCLGLRRSLGVVSHEGPLAYVLNMIASQLMAHGYPVAAPVFDLIHDMETLNREVAMDVARGFVGKTAIHPCQVKAIQSAYQVSEAEVNLAQAILDESAAAVFQIGGVMCEPATHGNWARRILARSRIWGMMPASSGEAILSDAVRIAV